MYTLAAKALNDIISGTTVTSNTIATYSIALQNLYITYVRLTANISNSYVLRPRAFFIYITQQKKYTSEILEGRVKDLVRDAKILDRNPTEIIGGKHINVLKIFTTV